MSAIESDVTHLDATHRNTLQHYETLRNTLQRTATQGYFSSIVGRMSASENDVTHLDLAIPEDGWLAKSGKQVHIAIHGIALQRIATHCSTLQHTATYCNTLQRTQDRQTGTYCITLQHIATRCNTLQHTATLCNSLQRTATHYNMLHRTATHGKCDMIHPHIHTRHTNVIASMLQCATVCCNAFIHTFTHVTQAILTPSNPYE